ncbi:MAG: Thiol:disulfide interchange protein DsbA [Gammaproteobacteria bacterium]|nr:MAG: Thiol:disulfide interchange protein DsbA [Gammaproteobacteria bacterium]|tara:strand:+ start:263 stop:877 length:615 start_codon:yes stop_codon:yes gene_type:complete
MKNLLILFFVAITSFSVVSFSAEGSQKYVQISNQKQTESDKIIIYEFFWYGCPHCYNIEPTINQIEDNLKKDTILIKVPVALRNTWEIHAKAYYTLQQMKLDDDLHEKIFSEIHVNANRLDTEEKLINFLNDEGHDAEKFSKILNSFGTEIRVKKASRLANQYQITSVPTLIINGKYRTSGSYVSSYEELYDVVQLLVDKERLN